MNVSHDQVHAYVFISGYVSYSFNNISLIVISLLLESKHTRVFFQCMLVDIHKFYNYEMYCCLLDFKFKNIGIL